MNTGWKTWDKYLSQYVGKKVKILEIGVYEGVASCWFLEHIMTNKKSKLYCIDTFEGSAEYTDVNFSNVEKTFYKNIKKTGREDQVIVLKGYSFDKLIKLNRKKTMFDIIFIDASHEARDVISDAVLSWKLLKENGTLIFDDYKWTNLKQEYFRPKIAIDSFIQIFKPELEVLKIAYQVLIRKKYKKDFEIPEISEEYK